MNNNLKENAKLLLSQLNELSRPLSDCATLFISYVDNLSASGKSMGSFMYNGEKYLFRLLSSEVLEFDKNILKNREEREKWESIRSLRIAACPYLDSASYLSVVSDMPKSLVQYNDNNETYIIDYSNNLIMREEDYFHIFNVQVIERIPAHELSYFNELIGKDLTSELLYFLVISYKDMKRDMQKHLPSFAPKLYASGVRDANRKILSLADENLFLLNHERFDDNDTKHLIYQFTIDRNNSKIKRNADDSYRYLNYIFYILSDYISEKYRSDAESTRRYHRCVEMSLEMLWYLGRSRDTNTLSLVMGKIPLKGRDKTTHFWVEFKAKGQDKYYALDFTGNIIMESDCYIRLINAKEIRRISYVVLDELFGKLISSPMLLDTFDVLYFAEDILRDLDKNKMLFKENC